jgi:hypothetical protein
VPAGVIAEQVGAAGADALPRIGVIATGGTMDALGIDRLDLAWYTETRERLSDGELLAAIPEVGGIAQVTEIPFPRVPSYALTTADWLRLAGMVDSLLGEECYDGLVVTHGISAPVGALLSPASTRFRGSTSCSPTSGRTARWWTRRSRLGRGESSAQAPEQGA